MTKNDHGISRDIPADVARQVRQQSKFGCVICRNAIYTYEHIDPPFREAKVHDPDAICLLCPDHQRESTEGTLPKKVIATAYQEIREAGETLPSRRKGFFDLFDPSPTIRIGGVSFEGPGAVTNIDGKDLLSFLPNLESEYPRFVINARFFDRDSNELFRVEANHWICGDNLWDVDIVAGKLTIRKRMGDILLHAEKHAQKNLLDIQRLDMVVWPFRFLAEKDILRVCRYTPSGDGYVCFSLSTTCRGSCCGIYCDSNEETIPRVGEIALVGGKGVYIDGTGIWLCRGNSSALIHRVELHSEGCETKPPLPKPPARQGRPFFVLGRLTSRVSKFLQWAEIEYYLDGYQLSNKPLSWGKVEYGDQGTRELFYISPDEVAPLEECDGYVGLWADDVLRQPWADQIFEVQVKVEESVVMRVKRSAAGDREIISDMDENARPLVPAVFAGINPWKPT